jgi:hypothetical protein
MEFATEFTVRSELDVDALIETESDEIQRLLNRALFLARHSFSFFLSFFLPLLTDMNSVKNHLKIEITNTQILELFLFFFYLLGISNLFSSQVE